jgi:hypothetical protein
MTLLDDATQVHYTLNTLAGRLITDPGNGIVSMYVYSSERVTLADASGKVICRGGSLTAGGDWRAASYAELTWPRRCSVMGSPQYLNLHLGGSGPDAVIFNER